MEGNKVTVVAVDMCVLILLMYHREDNMADICFHSELKKKSLFSLKIRTWLEKRLSHIFLFMSGVVMIRHLQHLGMVK